jgi:DNA-binding transcriptional regulator YbjK
MAAAPTYTAEDVQAILAEAMALQASDKFTRSQLIEMAAEMHISADLLDQVEQNWRQRQQHQAQEQARKQKQRRLLRQQVITYAVVNSGLILLNIATAGTITWAIFPLLGWGLGLLLGKGKHPCSSDRNRIKCQ